MTTEHTPEPWTEEETAAFTEALTTFRDSLPPRQREAFAAILQTAAEAAADQDVRGYVLNSDDLWRYWYANRTPALISSPTPIGSYPPGTRTDAAR